MGDCGTVIAEGMEVNVFENVMNALERKEEFKDTHTELLDELEEKKELEKHLVNLYIRLKMQLIH